MKTFEQEALSTTTSTFTEEFTENCDSNEITFRNPNETRHLGRLWAFFYHKGDPLVMIGPDCKNTYFHTFLTLLGPFSIIMIAAVLFFWHSSMEMLIHPQYPIATLALAYLLKSVQLAMMFIMVFKNPGWMSCSEEDEYVQDPRNETASGHLNTCPHCKIVSRKAVHCSRCNVCYEDLDHHCPWMNTCVAGGNLTEFYSFICLTFGGLFYALGLTMM